ncbi:unnamed protein product [Peronospora belbahrii]|uniref:Pericentrin/AKAP-450 centrosomal targeting domain-containing protein n=1 Tax=Peronospora belbahrii TaxID=622444 RepID=A0AAU9L7V8_9STRA|nr:unnamed protein product [Peronospora belbahrii]CAH0521341.1 unnamed protein product [Peronospora belbahrii]
MSTPSKSNNINNLRLVQLEKAARKLTLYSRALHQQLAWLREEMVNEKQAVLTSEDDVSESSARLQEIEELMAQLQEEIDALRMTSPLQDNGSLAAREQEMEELAEERHEELELLAHIQTMLQMHQNTHRKIKQMIATLMKEIHCVREREKIVVLAALRSRMFKIIAPKI